MKTILYVDDEIINLDLFRINFRNTNKVLTAENGLSGLKVLEDNPDVSIVISDMKMPGMNGIEFINQAILHWPDIQYYILTGFDITPEIEDALQQHIIHHYFQKPLNIQELKTLIG
jgi:two-component system, response regulator, stage 0 sporulation protein F